MKTIEDAVIELGGKWPSKSSLCIYMHRFESEKVWECSSSSFGALYSKEQFESCAKRLGYINGYRWGVEYPTNGERPELADDVIVELRYLEGGIWFDKAAGDSSWAAGGVVSFRIIDPRYKPAGTSYLNAASVVRGDPSIRDELNLSKSLTHDEEGLMHSEWWDYDKLQVKSGKLIPVGSEVLFFDRAPNPFKCKVMYSSEYATVIRCIDGSVNNEMIGVDISRCPFEENFNQIKPLDWNRKAELEREKVIEAAIKVSSGGLVKEMYSALYNAGMLVLPPNKSDTKD